MTRLSQWYAAILIVIVLLSVIVGPVSGSYSTHIVTPGEFTNVTFQEFMNGSSMVQDPVPLDNYDTIVFNPGFYALNNIIIMKDNLIFQSNSTSGTTQNTIIDGLGGSNGILGNLSSSGPANVTFKHLTLRDGYSTQSNTGGALGLYSNTTIISSDFINDTTDSSKKGGAVDIHSQALNLTITGSNFTHCSSGSGGAINTEENVFLIVTSSSFTDCSAHNSGSGDGGAINHVTTDPAAGAIINFCRFGTISSDTGKYVVVSTLSGQSYNLEDNWWGTNTPDNTTLTSNNGGQHLIIAPYLVLGITATPAGITTAQAGTIQANLRYDNTNTLVAGNILPDGIPVLFSVGSGPAGAAVSLPQVLTTNHMAATPFSSPAAGTAQVNASVDGYTVSVNVPVTAAPSHNNQNNRNNYGVNTGSSDNGYLGEQPTQPGFGPGPTKTIPTTPVETPTVTPATIPTHPVPVPSPTIPDRIMAVIQEYLIWLILIVIIIILVVLLRRWWIRRQNPGLFGK
jgi:hypothetical protein